MALNIFGTLGAVGRMLPGYLQGQRQAVADNWNDLNQYNQVQAGQVQNAFDEAMFNPRLSIGYDRMAQSRMGVYDTGMNMNVKREMFPGQMAQATLYSAMEPARYATQTAQALKSSMGGGNSMFTVPDEYRGIFEEASQQYGIPYNLLAAVAHQESRFSPTATSPRGAQGIMQLMPGTARELGVADPRDPRQNVMGGARYLRQQMDKFGSPELALAAYNAGPGRVMKAGNQIPNINETQNYVKNIMGNYTSMGGK